MRVEERLQEFLSEKRSIARNDKRQLRASANRATRDLHGVPVPRCGCCRTVLRAKLGNDGAYFLRLVSYDNKQLRWFEWQASAHDVLDERESPGAMQDFRSSERMRVPLPAASSTIAVSFAIISPILSLPLAALAIETAEHFEIMQRRRRSKNILGRPQDQPEPIGIVSGQCGDRIRNSSSFGRGG